MFFMSYFYRYCPSHGPTSDCVSKQKLPDIPRAWVNQDDAPNSAECHPDSEPPHVETDCIMTKAVSACLEQRNNPAPSLISAASSQTCAIKDETSSKENLPPPVKRRRKNTNDSHTDPRLDEIKKRLFDLTSK